MSWFSFGVQFSRSWSSLSTVDNFVTGQFAADYIFETQIAPSSAYGKIKQRAGDILAEYAKNHFKPSSRGIATRILKRHLTFHTIAAFSEKIILEAGNILTESIKEKLGFSTRRPSIEQQQSLELMRKQPFPINPSSNRATIHPPFRLSQTLNETPTSAMSSSSRLQSLRDYLNTHYDEEDRKELNALRDGWRIKDFILLSTQLSLRPICEKAVLDAIGSASKASTEFGIDLTSKKVITMTTLPLLSYLISTTAAWTSYLLQDYFDQSPYAAHGAQAVSYLPSTTTILTLSTAYHLGQIAYIWHSTRNVSKASFEDNKRVKQLAIQLVGKRLSDKVQNNPVTKKLNLDLSRETVDKIAINLINESIDNYWQRLSETHIFGMPLVHHVN